MKPNFALSLSFEGIRLLHRAAGGWRIVGEVGLETSDLPGELAVLRRTATALDPSGLRTKLLLPEGQIKYLTLDTPGLDNDARREAARAALDGATPYAVDDLAFDISVEGDQTHVAAVARETLTEAEGFATEHRFNPISFVAVPDAAPYPGEPFFGPTRASNALLVPGEEVEPDGIAVVVVGDVEAADGPVVDVPEAAEAVAEVAPEDPPKEALAEEDAPPLFRSRASREEAEPEAPEPTPFEAAEPLPAEPEPEPEPVVETKVAEPAPAPEASDDPEPLSASDIAEPAPSAAPENNADPIPVMPSLGAASRDTPPPKPKSAPDLVAPPPTPGFSSRRRDETPKDVPARQEPVVTAPVVSPDVDLPPVQGVADAGLPDDVPSFEAPPVPAPEPEERARPAAAALAAASAAAAPIGRFLSRRKSAGPAAAGGAVAMQPAVAAPAPAPATARDEAERMAVFGARRRDIGGKPRFLGLMLTVALLVFLAGVAAWASVFLDDGLNLSRLFGDRAPQATASAPVTPTEPEEPEGVQTASLEPTLTEEDNAVLDALREPVAPQIEELTPQQLEARYATTGIWPVAPDVPPEPLSQLNLDDLYLASIDPVSTSADAVALPSVQSFGTDLATAKVSSPAAAGTRFALNDQGLVIPTAAGALSPDGYTVFLGRPPLVPPATPTRFQAVPQDTGVRDALAAFRPQARPGDLTENNERAQLGGLTRSELAGLRPQLRPRSVQERAAEAAAAAAAAEAADAATETAEAAATPEDTAFDNPTRLAIKTSLRPDTRPRNFQRIVRRAQRTPQPQAQEERVASRQVAPRTVTPAIPTKTSVAKQATVRNAINLRKVNLIGVYGKPSNRRALVRLSNGRYKKVVVGDRIDGGRVVAIGDSELRYQKGNRNVVLKMPRT